MTEAGREIDALIAERVMGWKVFAGEPGYGRPPQKLISLILDPIPHYSTDIAAAWQVVEKLRADGWAWGIGGYRDSYGCNLIHESVLGGSFIPDQPISADTAPLAICLAALRTL